MTAAGKTSFGKTSWGLALVPAAALAAFALTPLAAPHPVLDQRTAWPLGIVAGALLFILLAGAPHPRLSVTRDRRARVAALATYVIVLAASEEVLWRGLLLGRLAASLGTPSALALSTIAFAAGHWATTRWRGLVTHSATGLSFGGLFAFGGGLGTAVAAHGTYNLLVLAAREADRRPASVDARKTAAPDLGPVGVTPRSPSASSPAVAVREAQKSFGHVEALRGVDLVVHQGEILALLGPNGAGKTTLISLLLGLRRPDRGTVAIFGQDPRRVDARKSLGVTPQETSFPPTLRVQEIIELVRAHYEDPLPAEVVLERFGLVELTRRQAGGLSGGQQRRLAVALAFAGNPRLVLLDEPTAGLDVEARRAVWTAVRQYVGSGGTILLTTHDLDEAETLASRIAVIARGRTIAAGSPDEIKARTGLKRVRLRTSSLPRLPAGDRVLHDESGLYSIETSNAGAVVRALAHHGCELDALEVQPLSLEEAFLDLTQDADE